MAAAAARALAVRRAKKKQEEKAKLIARTKLAHVSKLDEPQRRRVLHELKSRESTTFLASLIECVKLFLCMIWSSV
jgi:hypothetical protein